MSNQLTILFLLIFPSFCLAQLADAENLLLEAESLFEAREIEGAKLKFEKSYQLFEAAKSDIGQVNAAKGWGSALAYSHQNDSALIVLYRAIPAAERIEDKNALGELISVIAFIHKVTGQHEESIEINKRAAEIYRLRGDLALYSSRLNHMANSYSSLLRYDSAEILYLEAIRIKEEIKDSSFLHVVYNDAAIFYERARSSYGKSVEYYIKAINISERQAKYVNTARTLNNLSIYLINQGQFEKAQRYAIRSLVMMDTLGLKFSKGGALNALGQIAEEYQDYDAAEDYYEKAAAIFLEYENKPRLVLQYFFKARLEAKQGQFELAETTLSEGFALLSGMDDRDSEVKYQVLLGRILLETERVDEAENILRIALAKAREVGDLQSHESALWSLSKIAGEFGQFEEAYDLLREHGAVRDTIAVREKLRFAAQLEAEYERSKKDEAITNLVYSNEIKDIKLANRQKQVFLLTGGALVAVTAACLGFFLFNVKRKTEKVLEEKNDVIAKALDEKDLLLREIHHRVKNNLQVISSLLNLQSRFIKDPQAVSAINEGRSRVRSMALIHQNLYQKENITGVQVRDYFSKLLQELFDTYQIGNRIELETNIDDLNLDVDTIIPIGLILNELVSNALKYAFPEGAEGTLRIDLTEASDQLILEVQDSGIGMETSKVTDQPKTFGFRLIRSLAAKLKGELKLTSNQGTLISLKISNYKKAG